jgi:hypothetical protein
MNRIRTLSVTIAAAANLLGGLAHGEVLAREQVKAELAAARADGTLRAGGEAGLRLRDLHPGLYPVLPPALPGASRDTVRTELADARARGDLVHGESGLSAYELAPHRFPARPTSFARSRDDVRAELAEARVLGDLIAGESGLTQAELFPHRYAAARAEHAAAKARSAEQLAQGARTPTTR